MTVTCFWEYIPKVLHTVVLQLLFTSQFVGMLSLFSSISFNLICTRMCLLNVINSVVKPCGSLRVVHFVSPPLDLRYFLP